jgi:hypothetical protein
MSKTQGVIEANRSQINEIINATAVGYHEEVYVNIDDGRMRFLAGAPGGTVVAYTDFIEGDVKRIEGDAEAKIKVPALQDYIELASEGTSSNLILEFVGSEENQLAEQLQISTASSHKFEVGLTLPASASAMDNVPTDLPALFDDNNILINQAEERPVSTHVETYSETLDKILDVVDLREELEFYPIVVDDGQFLLNVGSEQGKYVNASLQADVEGEDVDNLYGSGFKEVVKSLDGQISVHTEQDSPLLILKEMNYGTSRHVLGPAN